MSYDIAFKSDKKQPIRNMKKKTMRQFMYPIFSGKPGAYQMDTLVNANGIPPYFLILINVNTRKGFAYPMLLKNGNEVYRCFNNFLDDIQNDISSITSDQDPAYTTPDMLYLFQIFKINHLRTTKNNHNKLGIINRFIKTLRDLNKEPTFTIQSMNKCIEVYNKHKHRAIGKSPNDFTYKDEMDYIRRKWRQTNYIRSAGLLNRNDHVRILDEELFKKKRFAYRPEYVKVIGIDRNAVQVQTDNELKNVETYPRYKLMLDNSPYLPKQQTINSGNMFAVKRILNHDKGRYYVEFENNTKEWIPIRNLRLDNLLKETPIEKEYWAKIKK